MNDYALGVPQALGTSSSPTFAGLTVTGAVTFGELTVTTLVVSGAVSFPSTMAVAGQATFQDGTAAAPGISFTSDPNSGMRRISDGNVGIVCNGVDVANFAAGYAIFTGLVQGTHLRQNGSNGQVAIMQHATAVVSAMSGATVTAASLIPAGSVVIGVTVRVTTLIEGAASFTIGDGTDADRWGTGIAVAAGTTTTGADSTITSVPIYAAATSVVLTATGSNFTAGAVRITVHYISLTAATS